VKREQVRLRKSVTDLRRQLTALSRTSQELVTKVTALLASQETEVAQEQVANLRPTSRSLGALRRRLGLTQVQFGTLLGVSGQAVGQWESKEGRVRMRRATLGALAGIQHIGRREARRRLESMVEPQAVRTGRRQ
jgi:DNA-binding transcriptional regulator YiaG